MERRFELRKEAMLAECEVAPQVFRGAIDRLARFVKPFAELLKQSAQRQQPEFNLNLMGRESNSSLRLRASHEVIVVNGCKLRCQWNLTNLPYALVPSTAH